MAPFILRSRKYREKNIKKAPSLMMEPFAVLAKREALH